MPDVRRAPAAADRMPTLAVAARRAFLDGRVVAVEEANGGFAIVAVPPGRHLLRLRPEGGWLIIAAVLAALGLAVTVALLVGRKPGVPG